MRLWTVTKIGFLESADLTQNFVCGVGMKREVYKRKVGIPDELLAGILTIWRLTATLVVVPHR